MATSTTTLDAIETQQVATLRGLTPTSISRKKFREEQGEVEFEEWAESNSDACFRRYAFEYTGEVEPPAVHDDTIVIETIGQALIVAYPKQWALYGKDNRRSFRKVVIQDRDQIRDAIGIAGASNYVDGQHVTSMVGHEIEEGDGVMLSVFDFETVFYRSTS